MWVLFVAFVSFILGFHVRGEARNDELGTFWYYTDIHVDMNNKILNTSGLWGTYKDDTSPLVAFTGIEKGNDEGYAENQPDFVILGGGSGPTGKDLTDVDFMNSLQFIKHHLKNAFDPVDVPVFPVFGRFDSIPLRLKPLPFFADWCFELGSTTKLWREWIEAALKTVSAESNLPMTDFLQGCHHSMVIGNDPKILLLGLNSPLWQLEHPEFNDPANQFIWLEKSLQWARNEKAKVFIISHIPPGTHEMETNVTFALHKPYNDLFIEYIRNYSDVISTVLSGYEHLDTFRVILDKSYHPIGTVFLAPSMSPKEILGVGSFNPRIRQYKYSRRTGQIIDYRQFWLNLEKPHPSWEVEYVASEVYRLKDLSPRSMATLLDTFTDANNKGGKWDSYWKYQLGSRPHESGECPKAVSHCRCRSVCSMRHLDVTELEKCRPVCETSNPRLRTIRQLENRSPHRTGSIGVISASILAILCTVQFT